MERIEVIQKPGEMRQAYLARVMIAYLDNAFDIENGYTTLVYDDAECDGNCLAEDIRNEFNLDEEDGG